MLHGEIYEDGVAIASWSAEEGASSNKNIIAWHMKINLKRTGAIVSTVLNLTAGISPYSVVYNLFAYLADSAILKEAEFAQKHA